MAVVNIESLDETSHLDTVHGPEYQLVRMLYSELGGHPCKRLIG